MIYANDVRTKYAPGIAGDPVAEKLADMVQHYIETSDMNRRMSATSRFVIGTSALGRGTDLTQLEEYQLDSLDSVEIIMDAEEHFGIEISDDEGPEYVTDFGKFVDGVKAKLAEKEQ